MKQVTRGLALLFFLLGVVACSNTEGQALPPTPTNEPVTATATTTTSANGASDNATEVDNTGLPATIAALLPNADPEHGRELTVQNGCTACHMLEEGVTVVGPSWYNIGTVAATRVSNESAALYLYHSIVDPNQHVVEGFLPNLMPQNYQEQLSEQDLADVIQYLLTLQQ